MNFVLGVFDQQVRVKDIQTHAFNDKLCSICSLVRYLKLIARLSG